MAQIKDTSFPEMKVSADQVGGGVESSQLPRSTVSGSGLGTAEIRIEGRYLVSDGTNDRVLIGRFI